MSHDPGRALRQNCLSLFVNYFSGFFITCRTRVPSPIGSFGETGLKLESISMFNDAENFPVGSDQLPKPQTMRKPAWLF